MGRKRERRGRREERERSEGRNGEGEEGESRGREGERSGERGGKGSGEADLSDAFHIPLYTFIYLYILSNTFIYLHIPSYFNISNIRKMRINLRLNNGHNSSTRASPRARI